MLRIRETVADCSRAGVQYTGVEARCSLTITISLSPDKERKLQQRAAETGQDIKSYVQQLIEKDLGAEPTVAEALAPFRKQVAESGMTDEQLETFFEEVRQEVWQEKQDQKSKQS
jgi:hypothetical protein